MNPMYHTPLNQENHHLLEEWLRCKLISYVETEFSKDGYTEEIRITTTSGPIIIRAGQNGLNMVIGHTSPQII